jgi:hypothetical protein
MLARQSSCRLSPLRVSPAADLTPPLARPITLMSGPRSHLVASMDAAILIRDLEPLLIAAETGKQADVAEATRQLLVAVERKNWLKAPR